ncbi:MAG: HDOD domain-containing protein [Sinobacteraceae bacterium]|nr:HDOD domain-containing protein [Nevskiaceae bacterium]
MTNAVERRRPDAPSAAAGQTDVFVARQPIYNTAMAVTAFELLYRHSPSASRAHIADPRQATLEVIASAALEIGLDRISGGQPVHINFPAELLADLPDLPLPPNLVVIEVLEDVRAEPDIVQGIRKLRARGHRIALDDYSPQVSDSRLLELADIVKVEITHPGARELGELVKELRPRGLELIAENVETPEHFENGVSLGFVGFQGYFLQHPQTFRAKRVPSTKLSTLRLVATLQNEQYSVDEVEQLLSQNVSMSYHVLRCINSSYYNLPRKISSIRQAVVILGVQQLRQLCSLLCLQGFDDRPPSLFINAMTRARMCEQLGKLGGASDTGAFFITGLFSLLNALTGMPIQQVVEELPLTAAIARALTANEGDLGKALQCTRAYERAAWDQVKYNDLPPALIRAAYMDAVFWAEQARALLDK